MAHTKVYKSQLQKKRLPVPLSSYPMPILWMHCSIRYDSHKEMIEESENEGEMSDTGPERRSMARYPRLLLNGRRKMRTRSREGKLGSDGLP